MPGLTQAELEARLAVLQLALYQGMTSVTVDGVRTDYRTVADLQAAIADLLAEIAEVADVPTSRCLRVSMKSGYC